MAVLYVLVLLSNESIYGACLMTDVMVLQCDDLLLLSLLHITVRSITRAPWLWSDKFD